MPRATMSVLAMIVVDLADPVRARRLELTAHQHQQGIPYRVRRPALRREVFRERQVAPPSPYRSLGSFRSSANGSRG
ncbi:hypothetical protein SAMN05216267_101066 [Actinacidiphila rubida]|uniref:Uncharacterized protein n=1 Tax=Actinacidiphila rubida TaxID=310780 RepID=A0A1H8JE28_9ACTN|nr:hypothetical protein SAMN05216267_101066 [Actinacidiphila rubida]